MDAHQYVSALDREGTALADAALGILDAAVPNCPDWAVRDLVFHVGRLHDMWQQIVSQGIERSAAVLPEQPDDDHLIDWFRGNLSRLVETLGATAPETPCWTWVPEQTMGFVQRRMAQETMVHRWDAQAAGGAPAPFEPDLAVDGVDEFLDIFLQVRAPDAAGALRGSVHLHATDAEGEWFVAAGDPGWVIRRGHEKGDAAIRGAASDLLLCLWRRLPLDRLDVVGDPAVAASFIAAPKL